LEHVFVSRDEELERLDELLRADVVIEVGELAPSGVTGEVQKARLMNG
jgi:hypothetical protein